MRGNSPIVVYGNYLYVGFADGQVACLATRDGALKWSRNLVEGNVAFKDADAAIHVDKSAVYVSGYFGSLVKMNRRTGDVLWRKEVRSGTHIDSDANRLYVTTTDSHTIALDKTTGVRQWDVPLYSGTLSHPLRFGNFLIVGTELGKAYILDTSKGQVLQRLPVSSGYFGRAATNQSSIFLLSGNGKVYGYHLVMVSED